MQGTATQAAANPFTRDGYAFDGWNTAADGSGTDFAPGEPFTFEADTTLYAQWTAQATIRFTTPDGETVTPDSRTIYTARASRLRLI